LSGKGAGRLIAADRTAASGVAVAGWCERDDQDTAFDLGAHQPVRGRRCRVEKRVAGPHVGDVVDPEVGMLEQVSGLNVNLELILVAEEIGIKTLLRHFRYCNTSDYTIEWLITAH
jgi:hypothetical protein